MLRMQILHIQLSANIYKHLQKITQLHVARFVSPLAHIFTGVKSAGAALTALTVPTVFVCA